MDETTTALDVSWREVAPDLWVGHRVGRCVGTIERGRGFLRVDPDGRFRGRYQTLEAAQLGSSSSPAARSGAVGLVLLRCGLAVVTAGGVAWAVTALIAG